MIYDDIDIILAFIFSGRPKPPSSFGVILIRDEKMHFRRCHRKNGQIERLKKSPKNQQDWPRGENSMKYGESKKKQHSQITLSEKHFKKKVYHELTSPNSFSSSLPFQPLPRKCSKTESPHSSLSTSFGIFEFGFTGWNLICSNIFNNSFDKFIITAAALPHFIHLLHLTPVAAIATPRPRVFNIQQTGRCGCRCVCIL